MLAIPFATITMVMSISFLTVLNVTYSVAWPVLIALTVDTLVVLIIVILLLHALWAKKPSMLKEKFLFANLSKAKSSKYSTIPYIQAAIALPLTYFVLTRCRWLDRYKRVVRCCDSYRRSHLNFHWSILVYASFNRITCCLEKHIQIYSRFLLNGRRYVFFTSHNNNAAFNNS